MRGFGLTVSVFWLTILELADVNGSSINKKSSSVPRVSPLHPEHEEAERQQFARSVFGNLSLSNIQRSAEFDSRSDVKQHTPLRKQEPKNNSPVFAILSKRLLEEYQYIPNNDTNGCPFGLCGETDDYPEETIRDLLQRTPELMKFFPEYVVSVVNRFGLDETESMCEPKSFTCFPKTAENTNNEMMTIVNIGDYKQGIISEVCGDPDKPCKYSSGFPNDKKVVCKQQYATTRFIVLGKDNKTLMFDTFKVPSCCVCAFV